MYWNSVVWSHFVCFPFIKPGLCANTGSNTGQTAAHHEEIWTKFEPQAPPVPTENTSTGTSSKCSPIPGLLTHSLSRLRLTNTIWEPCSVYHSFSLAVSTCKAAGAVAPGFTGITASCGEGHEVLHRLEGNHKNLTPDTAEKLVLWRVNNGNVKHKFYQVFPLKALTSLCFCCKMWHTMY